ncbi:ABC transporter substrate-binding protein [Paenibacillus selenitireducens]|uniref:ABC transporter substrate-binding protein n=1 Tax=Paenibacillus selenitireducens TaxID=1324314 RepID=A0A1T2XN78_9BACL|nr:iron-siderophore ABC transporter substrate-binding protein [Paenibacillus selenitireducens]OPA81311.1 ABC transporter substrate-binding protein [Paenibacillus selenitireducens]
MKVWQKGFFLVLIVSLFLTACSGGKSTSSDASAAADDKANTAEATEIVVKHAMGETKINPEPKRVVVLTNEGTEALLELGIKPVGAVKSWTGDPWYPHIKDDMEGVTNVGDEKQPNIELIASLKPDLILGTKMRHEKIYAQLSAIAPTVMSETLRGEWKDNFKLWAEAVNKKAEGDTILAKYESRIAAFKEKAGDQLKTQVSVVRFMPGIVRIYYNDTFLGIILKEIGFARPEKQDLAKFADDIGKERIPEMEGDILFYFTYETGNGEASALEKEWTNDSLWKNLNVVKNKKAFLVDDVIWNTAGGVRAANMLLTQLGTYFNVEV